MFMSTSQRITRADLESARAAHEHALRRYGMIDPTDRIGLNIGSRTYGNAYRLWRIPAGQSGHYGTPTFGSGGYLGMTARDAYDTLVSATAMVYAVVSAIDTYPRHGEEAQS